MVTLSYERAHTQIHKQDLIIHDKWLPSTHIVAAGGGSYNSDLPKMYRDGFTWSPYP